MKPQKLLLVFLMLVIISWPSLSFSQSGCCSHHGGVCGCNTSTGSQSCCDGTDSPSCGCQYIPPKPIPIPSKTTTSTTTNPLTTDYKALSSSLQTQLNYSKDDLQKAKNSISEQGKEMTRLKSEIDYRSTWLGILIIALIISVTFNFYKSKN